MNSELPPRLRPQGTQARLWMFIGQIVEPESQIADGWQLGTVCVMSSVDIVGDGLEYHLSVRLQDSPLPPSLLTIETVSRMFGLSSVTRMEPGNDPRIVHLYSPVSKGTP